MKTLLLIMGIMLAVGGTAQARGLVTIKQANKVVIHAGMSKHKIMGMIHCLNALKHHATPKEAAEAALTHVSDMCALANVSDERCDRKKMRVVRHVYNCYAKAMFFREYLKGKTE